MEKEKNIVTIVENEKYRITLERGRKYNGSRNRYSETFNGTLKEAIERRDELKYQFKHYKMRPDSSMNFLEYTKMWLRDYAEVNVKPSTLEGYRGYLNSHILPRFKDYRLIDITVYELEKFYNDLRKTKSRNKDSEGNYKLLSESTVRHQHSLLCIMLNTAVRWDFINFNPCLKLTKAPKVTRPEMKFYDEDEITELFKHLEYENLTFKVAIYTLLLGGMRRGECLGLCWQDVDFENKVIHIKSNLLNVHGKGVYVDSPKTKRSKRTISLPDICFTLFKELKEKQEALESMHLSDWIDTDYVFKNEVGNYYNPERLSRNWKSFLKKHNLRVIRLHDLRHTCATYLLSHNTPIATVSKKLGHSNIYTTLDVYTHPVDKDDIEASEVLNKIALEALDEVNSNKD